MSDLSQDMFARQRLASDPKASVWVAANAGTGKTYVLIQRVVRLLLSGARPERILCLTFTNAAAAEMSTRLFETLGEWATSKDQVLVKEIETMTGEGVAADDLPQARRLFARALETPGGLKIQTIHAFCQRLLSRFPLEAAVPPHFDLLDERTSADLLYAARVQLYEEAVVPGHPLNDALMVLVARYDETAFAALLDHAVSKRALLQRLLAKFDGADGAAHQLRLDMGLRGGDSEESLLEEAFSSQHFDRAFVREVAAVLATGSKEDIKKSQKLLKFLNQPDLKMVFGDYASVFLTDKGGPRSRLFTKKIGSEHPAIADFLEKEQNRILELQNKLKSVTIADASWALFTLAQRFLEIYDGAKRAHRGLDYDDLILRSRDLLHRSQMAPWVLYKLDGGLDHILVDEAQDTSPDQWQVIEALAAEFFSGFGAREDVAPDVTRTLFVVGDEKQSIYAFQGADPDKFHEMREAFATRVKNAGKEWRDVDFTLSFRSTPQVLHFVDTLFAPDHLRTSLTAAGGAVSHQTVRQGQAGYVEFWSPATALAARDDAPWDAPLDSQAPGNPKKVLANALADQIRSWLDKKEILESQARPIEPGDIMILVRRRDALVEQIIRELKSKNIPVAGIDRMRLTAQIAVKDLLALADFVLQTGDDLSLAVVLKSPLVGLSEDQLFDLAYSRKDTLWTALQDQAVKDGEVWQKASDYLGQCLARADQMPPFEFFHHILDGSPFEKGRIKTGRACLLERLGRDAGDPLDEFLNAALIYERSGPPTLQGFVHWLREADTDIKRQLEQASGEVRVMTVHGSKGLDANIVILPDTCQVVDGKSDDKLLKTEKGLLVLRPGGQQGEDALTSLARGAYGQKREAEQARLLYVAATRARDRLYIMGHHGVRGVGKGAWYESAALAAEKLGEEIERPFGPAWALCGTQSAPPDVKPGVEVKVAEQVEPLPLWLEQTARDEGAVLPVLSPSRLKQGGGLEAPPLLSPVGSDGGKRFLRGGLVHKLLEFLPDMPLADRAARGLAYLDDHGLGFSGAERTDLLQETLAVLETPDFAPLFQPGSRAEVALAGVVPGLGKGALVSGKIDRLVVEKNKVLVVDYKTNRPPPFDPEKVAPLYLRQMAVYRALLQNIFPTHSVECLLLWTDGPRLMELPSDLLNHTLDNLRG